MLEEVVRETGVRRISFKDSLFLPKRLAALAAGLVERRRDLDWSCATKVSRANWRDIVPQLANAGMKTVELGFETSIARLQQIVDKKERPEDLLDIVHTCQRAGVRVVVNRITRLPWQTAEEAAEDDRFFALLDADGVHVEANDFELERAAPFAQEPDRWGLEVARSWPWATQMAARVAPSAARRPPQLALARAASRSVGFAAGDARLPGGALET